LKQIEQQQVVHLDSANQNEAKLTVFRNELSTIETACEDAKNRARKALELFEGVTLRKGGRLLPFPSIFGAHTGDVVRVFKRQLDQMKTESARAIEIQNDHYEWLIGDGNIKTNFHLLRVIEESQERLVFSYRQAYFVVKVNQ
jgi:hypothetical protein